MRPNLVIRLEQRIDELVAGLLVELREAHPALADDDPERTARTLSDARAMLRTFFACYLEGREPQPDELDAVLRDGALRAGEAVPLDELLGAYHEGGEMLWRAAVAEAGPDEQPELVDLARHLLHWQGRLARAAAEAFVRELRHRDHGSQAARRMLAQALLNAAALTEPPVPSPAPPSELVERAGVRLPMAAEVLAYQALDGPRAAGATTEAVQSALDELMGEPVLAEIGTDGGVLLLPAEDTVDLPRVLAALDQALSMRLVAGVASAAGTEHIPAAAREARELVHLAVALELSPGLYRQDRLLLEHALSARRTSVEALAALLDPLERRPNLLLTLETWFAQDFDRGGTAEALSIHRNTLDYRLRRIGDLTGLALDAARGLQTAGAALLARRLLARRTATRGR